MDDQERVAIRVDWASVCSMSACAVVMSILFHEAIHALTCHLVGGTVNRFSMVHVNCTCPEPWQFRIVAASGTIGNLGLASLLYPRLRKRSADAGSVGFFLWTLFTINLLLGAGYWFASGLTGVGDWAAVIRDWEPRAWYRIGLIILGFASIMGSAAWSLIEFGRLIPSDAGKPIGTAQLLSTTIYTSGFIVMFALGFAQPAGPFSFPGVTGLVAVLGGLSPLLWMMQWFRADMFVLRGSGTLEIHRTTWSLVSGLAAVAIGGAVTLLGQ